MTESIRTPARWTPRALVGSALLVLLTGCVGAASYTPTRQLATYQPPVCAEPTTPTPTRREPVSRSICQSIRYAQEAHDQLLREIGRQVRTTDIVALSSIFIAAGLGVDATLGSSLKARKIGGGAIVAGYSAASWLQGSTPFSEGSGRRDRNEIRLAAMQSLNCAIDAVTPHEAVGTVALEAALERLARGIEYTETWRPVVSLRPPSGVDKTELGQYIAQVGDALAVADRTHKQGTEFLVNVRSSGRRLETLVDALMRRSRKQLLTTQLGLADLQAQLNGLIAAIPSFLTFPTPVAPVGDGGDDTPSTGDTGTENLAFRAEDLRTPDTPPRREPPNAIVGMSQGVALMRSAVTQIRDLVAAGSYPIPIQKRLRDDCGVTVTLPAMPVVLSGTSDLFTTASSATKKTITISGGSGSFRHEEHSGVFGNEVKVAFKDSTSVIIEATATATPGARVVRVFDKNNEKLFADATFTVLKVGAQPSTAGNRRKARPRAEVTELQTNLRRLGLVELQTDGRCGPQTLEAVDRFVTTVLACPNIQRSCESAHLRKVNSIAEEILNKFPPGQTELPGIDALRLLAIERALSQSPIEKSLLPKNFNGRLEPSELSVLDQLGVPAPKNDSRSIYASLLILQSKFDCK